MTHAAEPTPRFRLAAVEFQRWGRIVLAAVNGAVSKIFGIAATWGRRHPRVVEREIHVYDAISERLHEDLAAQFRREALEEQAASRGDGCRCNQGLLRRTRREDACPPCGDAWHFPSIAFLLAQALKPFLEFVRHFAATVGTTRSKLRKLENTKLLC